MNHSRRIFLRATAATSITAVAAAAGLLNPRSVLASAWPKPAFDARSVDAALGALGTDHPVPSGQVAIQAPDIAENGAVVSVTVSTTLPNVTAISIMARENTSPLAASYVLAAGTDAFISSRIKMRKTSQVIAVVNADGKLYSAAKNVKVTLGGCGG